jgi:Flp pilus assembly protein TadG
MVERLRARGHDESGAIIVLFALMLVVLFAFVAMAIDLSRLFHQRQLVQNAVDFGSLAGAQDMPVKGAAQASVAASDALKVTLDNAPTLLSSSVASTFRCVVTDNGSGGPVATDLGIVCGPAVAGSWTSGWVPKHGKVAHACDPYVGDMCNTIVVSASSTVPYFFAPVIGITSGTTGAVQAASCKGACGNPASPLDVALVLDRTASMTAQDLANAKAGALALLEAYDPNVQHVGLVVLPYGAPANKCVANGTQTYPNTNDSLWQATGFSSDYQLPDGTLNNNSALVKMINCLQLPPGNMQVTPSGNGHTDEGDPLKAARDMLTTQGRPGVPDVIIFETDGEANQPAFMQPCAYAINQADLAKAAGIDIFTLAYGVTGARCTGDTSGTYQNMWASTYLAAMATNSKDYAPGTCKASENTDGDNYFCEATKGDITAVFRRIASTSIQHSHLLDI